MFKKGHITSEETRKKIGLANSIALKGRKLSEEHKRKISENSAKYWLGKNLFEETKKKISFVKRGKRFSEEVRKNMSLGCKKNGIGLWMKGKKRSEETKRKIGEVHRGNKNVLGKHWKLSKEIIKKMSETRKGENSHWWKGGITPLRQQIKLLLEYKQWRKVIFERDSYTCQICKIKGGQLQIDHYPKTFAQIFYDNNINSLDDAMNCQEFWNINNGRVLCVNCHKNTSTYGSRNRFIDYKKICQN